MVRAWLGEDGRGLLRISAVCRRDDSGKFAENSEYSKSGQLEDTVFLKNH